MVARKCRRTFAGAAVLPGAPAVAAELADAQNTQHSLTATGAGRLSSARARVLRGLDVQVDNQPLLTAPGQHAMQSLDRRLR